VWCWVFDLLLRNRKCFLYGLDISTRNVSIVDKNFSEQKNFKGCEVTNDGFFNNKKLFFDVIFLVECIEHILPDKLDECLKRIFHLLKIGGSLVLTTPNKENFFKEKALCPCCGAMFHRVQHMSQWTTSTLVERMRSCGFIEKYCFETAFTGYWYLNKFYGIAYKFYYGHKPNLIYIGQKLK
jgi:2-polyprenyl-3-methyl-5-hydroxy-6-metoxy-1,4-benzoquinol methylase